MTDKNDEVPVIRVNPPNQKEAPWTAMPPRPPYTYSGFSPLQAAMEAGQVPMLTGTVKNLQHEIEAIRDVINSTAISVLLNQQPAMATEIETVKSKLATINDDVLPKLHKVDEFIKNEAAFVTNAIAADGLIRGLQGHVSSLEQRMNVIEIQREREWSRKTTVWTIVISVLSFFVGVGGTAIAFLVYLGVTP